MVRTEYWGFIDQVHLSDINKNYILNFGQNDMILQVCGLSFNCHLEIRIESKNNLPSQAQYGKGALLISLSSQGILKLPLNTVFTIRNDNLTYHIPVTLDNLEASVYGIDIQLSCKYRMFDYSIDVIAIVHDTRYEVSAMQLNSGRPRYVQRDVISTVQIIKIIESLKIRGLAASEFEIRVRIIADTQVAVIGTVAYYTSHTGKSDSTERQLPTSPLVNTRHVFMEPASYILYSQSNTDFCAYFSEIDGMSGRLIPLYKRCGQWLYGATTWNNRRLMVDIEETDVKIIAAALTVPLIQLDVVHTFTLHRPAVYKLEYLPDSPKIQLIVGINGISLAAVVRLYCLDRFKPRSKTSGLSHYINSAQFEFVSVPVAASWSSGNYTHHIYSLNLPEDSIYDVFVSIEYIGTYSVHASNDGLTDGNHILHIRQHADYFMQTDQARQLTVAYSYQATQAVTVMQLSITNLDDTVGCRIAGLTHAADDKLMADVRQTAANEWRWTIDSRLVLKDQSVDGGQLELKVDGACRVKLRLERVDVGQTVVVSVDSSPLHLMPFLRGDPTSAYDSSINGLNVTVRIDNRSSDDPNSVICSVSYNDWYMAIGETLIVSSEEKGSFRFSLPLFGSIKFKLATAADINNNTATFHLQFAGQNDLYFYCYSANKPRIVDQGVLFIPTASEDQLGLTNVWSKQFTDSPIQRKLVGNSSSCSAISYSHQSWLNNDTLSEIFSGYSAVHRRISQDSGYNSFVVDHLISDIPAQIESHFGLMSKARFNSYVLLLASTNCSLVRVFKVSRDLDVTLKSGAGTSLLDRLLDSEGGLRHQVQMVNDGAILDHRLQLMVILELEAHYFAGGKHFSRRDMIDFYSDSLDKVVDFDRVVGVAYTAWFLFIASTATLFFSLFLIFLFKYWCSRAHVRLRLQVEEVFAGRQIEPIIPPLRVPPQEEIGLTDHSPDDSEADLNNLPADSPQN